MTTTTNHSHLSDYFNYDSLLGGDPFDFDQPWDADLRPDEYGDQSGVVGNSWDEDDDDDDEASFTDSEGDCSDDDEDHEHDVVIGQKGNGDEEWSLVYATSITVVTSARAAAPLQQQEGEEKSSSSSSGDDGDDGHCPANPLVLPRRDSKVRFCEQPPQVVSYELCSPEEHSRLYYSCHELQKIIDEMRQENTTTATTTTNNNTTKPGCPSASNRAASPKTDCVVPARST